MPRHIEQPADRHSNPASTKIWSRPSDSACCLTRIEPGTTIARIPERTCLPRTTFAARRRSSIRLLVHDPMKTVSTAISRTGVPGFRFM